MEFGGGVSNVVDVADHDIEGVAPRANRLQLVCWIVEVGFDRCVGGQGNVSIEMVEAENRRFAAEKIFLSSRKLALPRVLRGRFAGSKLGRAASASVAGRRW